MKTLLSIMALFSSVQLFSQSLPRPAELFLSNGASLPGESPIEVRAIPSAFIPAWQPTAPAKVADELPRLRAIQPDSARGRDPQPSWGRIHG